MINIGQFFIVLAGIAAVSASFVYIFEEKKKGTHLHAKKTGNYLFHLSVGSSIAASFMLFYALFVHDFQYSYVAQFSSIKQPVLYLISAFWAGQEGTFLLWMLLNGLMGRVLLKTTKGEDKIAMVIVSLFTFYLTLLMMVKSPFEITAKIPQDGQGMNPLLQDPWMAIHPPLLFVGYAAALFPFALVVSGLIRKKYNFWLEQGFAWTLFASLMLGTGIIIGGFWAYEVLGWGGYWGWDPVENSSLVPWLMLLALIHGLLIQKNKGALLRTNMMLAIVSFLLVLYATFLTRSGILADFSVHSFTDAGINNYLIGIMVTTIAVSFGAFGMRFRDIKFPKIGFSGLNREIMLLLSLYALIAAALFTFAGMSSPIITGIFGKASQVDTSFYNKVNTPIAIIISLLLGITPFLGWADENVPSLFKRLSLPIILTGLSCIIAYVGGVTQMIDLLFIGSAAFGLISNSVVAFRQYRSGWSALGGPMTHIGTTLLLIGIIGSGKFDETKQLILKKGETQSLFGYSLTFKDIAEDTDKKTRMVVEVSDGKNVFTVNPKLYWSDYNQAIMREPNIKILPLKDLYFSPLELKMPQEEAQHDMIEITKGQSKEYNGYKFEFIRFETGAHGKPGSMSVGAYLNVTAAGKDTVVIPSISISETGEQEFVPAGLPVINAIQTGDELPHVMLAGMSVEEQKVMLAFHGFGEHKQQESVHELVLEVSMKPLMMVVWTGTVLIIAGSGIAFTKRLRKEYHV